MTNEKQGNRREKNDKRERSSPYSDCVPNPDPFWNISSSGSSLLFHHTESVVAADADDEASDEMTGETPAWSSRRSVALRSDSDAEGRRQFRLDVPSCCRSVKEPDRRSKGWKTQGPGWLSASGGRTWLELLSSKVPHASSRVRVEGASKWRKRGVAGASSIEEASVEVEVEGVIAAEPTREESDDDDDGDKATDAITRARSSSEIMTCLSGESSATMAEGDRWSSGPGRSVFACLETRICEYSTASFHDENCFRL